MIFPDADLAFLWSRSNEDLDPLVGYILKAKTNTLAVNDRYKASNGDHRVYMDVVVQEIREFGGNSLVNAYRGDGVAYEVIVRDVADKLGVKYAKSKKTTDEADTVEEIELKILTNILEKSVKKMTEAERRTLEEEFHNAGVKNIDFSSGVPLGVMLAQGGVQLTGFLAYRVAVIVANAVARVVLGRGLSLAANAALTRLVGVFAGPVGWAISGIWTVIDLAGPAYRVTIPVVCQVAYLRQKKRFEDIGDM